ncbi:hypothetical protein MJO28_010684 [Puccinia striiformis f. sp. tritici]|uniref:Uncharacterized protein n=1 Tax=Puccinia striiformis f. sp. tritici TaxID=168172 RepID=A0ACC0E7A5_9BASI|nr:hypothetical protein MJO28_010684 [Puccinia striiformis f. sp. tritici]
MIHLTELNYWSTILYILLTSFHYSDCLIRTSQQGIEADLPGEALNGISVTQTPRPLTPDVRDTGQAAYYGQSNGHPAYLPQHPSSDGHYGLEDPVDGFSPLPRIRTNRKLCDLGQPEAMLQGPRSSTRGSFDSALTQRMLDCKPFIPGFKRTGKDLDPVKPSSDQTNEAGQPVDRLEKLAKPSNMKVLNEVKPIMETEASTDFDYAIDPNHLRSIHDFLFKSMKIGPNSRVVDDKVAEPSGHPAGFLLELVTRSKQGSPDPRPKDPRVAAPENPELARDGTPAFSPPESSSKLDITSQQRPSALSQIENTKTWRPKARQKRIKKQQAKSESTGLNDTAEKVKPSDKRDKSPLHVYETEYPTLTSLSEGRSPDQLGKSSNGRIPDHKKYEENGSDQTVAPPENLHHASKGSGTPREPLPDLSNVSRRKVIQEKGTPNERLSQSPRQTKTRGSGPSRESLNILDQKDRSVTEKTLSLLGIEEPELRKPAAEKKTLPGTPRKGKKQNALAGLSQQAKKVDAQGAPGEQTGNQIKAAAKDGKDKLPKISAKTPLSADGEPIKNLQKTDHNSNTNSESAPSLLQPQGSLSMQLDKMEPGSSPPKANEVSPADTLVTSAAKTVPQRDQPQDPVKGAQATEILDTQGRETIKQRTPQSNLEKKKESLAVGEETVKSTQAKVPGIPQRLDQSKHSSPSKPDTLPAESAPPSTTGLNTSPPSKIDPSSSSESDLDRISDPSSVPQDSTALTQTNRQIQIPKDTSPLHTIPPKTEQPGTLKLRGSTSSRVRKGRNTVPPDLPPVKRNRKINHDAIIPLESAFGDLKDEEGEIENGKAVPPSSLKKKSRAGVNVNGISALEKRMRVTNSEAHFHLGFLDEDGYKTLLAFWERDKDGYKKAEIRIRDSIGTFEGTRRMITLRRQILKHTISRQWQKIRYRWFGERRMGATDARGFEIPYGISSEPAQVQDIPKSTALKLARREDWEDDSPIEMIWGAEETQRQVKMRLYLAQRTNPYFWWEDYSLDAHSKFFGLDVLTIIKVGDALQFGSQFLLPRGYGRMTIDSAYAQLLRVMTDTNRPLPWIESSERAWLQRFLGDLYTQRLQKLSVLISQSRVEMNPLSIDILAEKVDPNFVRGSHSQLGEELAWVDKGLPLNELINKIKARKSDLVHHNRFILPQSNYYYPINGWELKDLMVTNAQFFWNSIKKVAGKWM